MQENLKHSVNIEQRKSISVTGVESVVAFSEVKIILKLQDNQRMHVVGTGLKIIGFSKTNGTFLAEGSITGMTYGSKSFTAKLFR